VEPIDEFAEALAASRAHVEASARLGHRIEADLIEVPRRIIGDEAAGQWGEIPPGHRRRLMDPGPSLVAVMGSLVARATAVGIFGHVHTPLPGGSAPSPSRSAILPDGSAPKEAPVPYFDSRPKRDRGAGCGRRILRTETWDIQRKQNTSTAMQTTSSPR